MAVVDRKLTTIAIVVFTFALMLGGAYTIYKISTQDSVTPDESDASATCGDNTCATTESCSSCAADCGACPVDPAGDGTKGCGESCTDASECAGPNPICTSSGQCYDAQECGDGDDDDGSGSGADEVKCRSFNENEDGSGEDTVTVAQGESVSIDLYVNAKANGDERIRGYKYTTKSKKYGTVNPTTGSDTSTTWTMTAAQTAALSIGNHKNAVEASVTGKEDRDSCDLTLIVTAATPGQPNWVLSQASSTTCNADETEGVITYTVTLKNIGDTEGTIAEVVESLDTTITEDMVSGISPTDGDYDADSNTITWDTGYTLAGGASKTFTYKVTMDKEDFTTLENTTSATAADGDGDSPDDDVNTNVVSCSLPDTAIISDLADTLIIAFGLLLAGFIVLRFDLFNLINLKAMSEGKREASKEKFVQETLRNTKYE